MKKIQLSTDLFQQIGGLTYLSRPAYFKNNPRLDSATSLQESPETQSIASVSEMSAQPVEKVSTKNATLEKVVDHPESAGLLVAEIKCVILGSGLNGVWEDDSKAEWQLLQNICQAFMLSESQLSYFDTDALVSDEAIFTTMEEVIDLGVEWVFSMDSEHPISEQLSEGVQVFDVPSLEQMLFDPYAKQSFYQVAYPLLKPV